MKPITYLSEPPEEYNKVIDNADTLLSLQSVLLEWRELAGDAYKTALAMSEDNFLEFRVGLRLERRGKFAGEAWSERFANIVMPELMFRVSIAADKFKVPWGAMYIRLKEAGKLPETAQ